MATARLTASTYSLSSTTYLSVSNADNMYTNTDSDTYATVTNSQTGTTSYYIYIKGFNFDAIPSAAVVTDWTVKLKAQESGVSTSSSYAPKLCHGTSQITSTMSAVGTTATTLEFTSVGIDWEDAVEYGSDFGIRINCRRASRNTTGYMYIYGAEIEVTYTVPDPRTITPTLSGDGTISPNTATTKYDGDVFTLTITPTDKTAAVTCTNNNTDVTDQLEPHYESGDTQSTSAVLGTYSLVSGGFNGSGASYFQGLVGKGHTASTTSSNYYSSGSGTTAVFQYDISFSGIPSNAIITGLYMMANGHAESTSNSSEYMCVQLKSGNTELSEQYNFKNAGSTSNSTQTIEATTLPTVAQLDDLVVECTLGYYGGAINGVTVFIEYAEPGADVDYYTYEFVVNGNATVAVVIGSGGSSEKLYVRIGDSGNVWAEVKKIYVKANGSWQELSTLYKKENGSWVEQSSIAALFNGDIRLINGSI